MTKIDRSSFMQQLLLSCFICGQIDDDYSAEMCTAFSKDMPLMSFHNFFTNSKSYACTHMPLFSINFKKGSKSSRCIAMGCLSRYLES